MNYCRFGFEFEHLLFSFNLIERVLPYSHEKPKLGLVDEIMRIKIKIKSEAVERPSRAMDREPWMRREI